MIALVLVAAAAIGLLVVEGVRCDLEDRRAWRAQHRCEYCDRIHEGWPAPGGGYLCERCFVAAPPFCRSCGCTEWAACAGGCWWVADPFELGHLCSACQADEVALHRMLKEQLG